MLKAESRCPGGGGGGGCRDIMPWQPAGLGCSSPMVRQRSTEPVAAARRAHKREHRMWRRRRDEGRGEREEERATTAWCKGCIGVMQGRPIGGLTAEGDLLGFYVIGSRRFRHAGSRLAVLLRSTHSHTKHASFHFSSWGMKILFLHSATLWSPV